MTFTQTCTIAASRQAVWDFLMQAENAAQCLPGVEAFNQIDADTYSGTLRVKVGPISLAFQGNVYVETRDQAQWHGAIRAEARDHKRGGGVRARLHMDLHDKGATETELEVTLEAHLLGKIGEFGQPVIRKKANAILQTFATQVGQRLTVTAS